MNRCLRNIALAVPAWFAVWLVGMPVAQAADPATVPSWVFPLNPPAGSGAYDTVRKVQIPGSRQTYTEAQLNNRFDAPDWFPSSHTAAPTIVTRGRSPDVYACGYCHTPAGQGRPENASLAGLPEAYILQQLADFKSGARRSVWTGPYGPTDGMINLARQISDPEAQAAAKYFSQQTLRSHVRVVESARVPKSHVVGWVYAADASGGKELIGERMMEFAPDPQLHEQRDDQQQYLAYVPPGSLHRGRLLARTGKEGPALACVTCHGDRLQGVGLIPRLAGRSPTYLMRQLIGFRTGARSGATGQPMRAVVDSLSLDDMIGVVAYAAALKQ